jgi:cell division ATPase FtsA
MGEDMGLRDEITADIKNAFNTDLDDAEPWVDL